MNIILLAALIGVIAVIMTMTGRGGGNFYVLAIALSGIGMHEAATTGQFILIISSLAATITFGKRKITDWKLVLIIGSLCLASAFFGGLLSGIFQDKWLKIIFAGFIFLASLLMLMPGKDEYSQSGSPKMNYLLVIPFILITGFISGMVGISGGSFLVPLLILALRIPVQVAVGTSTTLVLVTATSGFLGHLSSGHFDFRIAWPLALAGLIGGMLGARLTFKIKPKKIKFLFAITSLIAAILMLINAFHVQ